jgi:leader peptidase (prepilin peptidase)/N-methyltransferase
VSAISLPPESYFYAFFFFIFGLAFGSFLNVCIYRLPRGMSLMPSSACPNCGAGIKPYDNIPVAGWLLLRGKCRNCKLPISPRYVVVELLTGFLFVLAFMTFGLSAEAIKYCVFSFLIVGLIFTDADLKLLPDAMTLPGTGLGLLFSLLVTQSGTDWVGNHSFGMLDVLPFELRWRAASFIAAALGAAFGSFMIWGIGEVYKLIRGVEGMGFGDVKLMAMVGAFLGVKLTMLTLLLGSMSGSVAGMFALVTVLVKRLKRYRGRAKGSEKAWSSAQLVLRRYEMPFGVFLGTMAMFSAYFGEPVMNWYLGFYR